MEKKKQENTPTAVPRQLALPFTYQPRFIQSEFVGAKSNAIACTWLGIHSTRITASDWPDRRLLIWGEAGTGKTHLLQIWAEKHDALLLPGTVLSQNNPMYWSQQLRNNTVKALVIDDADMVTHPQALLHVLNTTQELAMPLILSGRLPPSRWDINLADLKSRLRAIMAIKIERAEEALLRILLLRLLAERQMVVASSVAEWLLLRLPRSAAAIREAVERLDHAALADGGGVTRELATEALHDLLSDPSAELCYDSKKSTVFNKDRFMLE